MRLLWLQMCSENLLELWIERMAYEFFVYEFFDHDGEVPGISLDKAGGYFR